MNTTRLLRHVNSQNCLALLREKGAMTRAEMARELGTTRTTVGYAIGELAEAGLVTTAETLGGSGQTGRPGMAIRLAPDGAFFVGVELATRHVAAVLLDLDMHVRETLHLPTDLTDAMGDDIVRDVLRAVGTLAGMARIDQRRVYGLGVSVPSIVAPSGLVMLPPGTQQVSVDIVSLLAAELPTGWVIRCCNNAAAVAVSLCETLTAAEKEDFLFILLTDGVGSARVRQGRVEKGFRGVAGEIGYMVMGPRLSHGPERYQALAGYQRFAHLMDPADDPAVALQILAAASSPPTTLRSALADWADCLSAGLLNAIYMTDPARILLGGPLAVLYPLIEDQVRSALRASFLPGVAVPSVERAVLDPDVAAIGAAALIRQDLFAVAELTRWRSAFAAPGFGKPA